MATPVNPTGRTIGLVVVGLVVSCLVVVGLVILLVGEVMPDLTATGGVVTVTPAGKDIGNCPVGVVVGIL